MFSKFLNRYSDAGAADGAKLFPIFRVVFGPYNLFIDNARRFFAIGGIFALIMTVVFMLLGQNVMCSFEDVRNVFCSNNPWVYLVSKLIGLGLIAVFAVRLYQITYQDVAFSWKNLFKLQLRDAKAAGALLAYLLLNMISLLSIYALYVRVPNPDWRIELCYFAVVSVGFLVPFVLLRFYSLLAFVLAGEKFPSLKYIWQNTAGNGLRLVFSFALIFCILVFSLNAVANNFRLVALENTIYISFIAEYLFNLVLLLNMTFFVNYCYLQKNFLFGEK